MPAMPIDAAAIKRKLASLRKHDMHCGLFGSKYHRYMLAPCIGQGDLDSFEVRFRVQLPEEYREFLLTVGNGGAGPCYGLYSLGQFSEDRFEDANSVDLASPFPHNKVWNPADESEADDYFSPSQTRGAMPICHEGCGYYDLLVVSGGERGHMWIDGRVSDQGIHPITTDDGSRMTFASWYGAWLDECLREVGVNPKSLES